MKEIKEPDEQVLDAAEALTLQTYASFSSDNECFIVVGRGAFAFRWGPMAPKEAGKILEWSVKNRVVCSLVMNCGPEFDEELARDMGMKMILPEDRKTPKGLLARFLNWSKAK